MREERLAGVLEVQDGKDVHTQAKTQRRQIGRQRPVCVRCYRLRSASDADVELRQHWEAARCGGQIGGGKLWRFQLGVSTWRDAEHDQGSEVPQASQLRTRQGLAVQEDDGQDRQGTQLRGRRQHPAAGATGNRDPS